MKASDVIIQLQTKLPEQTNLFSTEHNITSLTRSGSTVTAVTDAPHGLADNQIVVINGAIDLNPITSLTFANGLVTAETQNDHNLTVPSRYQVADNNLFDFNKAYFLCRLILSQKP